MCSECHKKIDRIHYTVVSMRDGTVFKSIMDWSKQVGVFDQYQKLRIRLMEQGMVTINGEAYQLESKSHQLKESK